MTNSDWWNRDWYCGYCKTTIKRHHRARHYQSKMHIRNYNAATAYVVMASDLLFTDFLNNFDTRRFKGLERLIYQVALQKEVRTNERKMQENGQGYLSRQDSSSLSISSQATQG